MNPAGSNDWIWFTAGWAAMALGVVGVLLALYVDRSRGRRRCKRCWYDLSKTPGLVCSECGKMHRHEGQLYRTRRHGWWSALGVLLIVGGRVMYEVPPIKRDGLPGYAPTWALVRFMDRLEGDWANELRKRLGPDTTQEQWRAVIVRAMSVALNPEGSKKARLLALGVLKDAEGTTFFSTAVGAQWGNRLEPSKVDAPGLVRGYWGLLEDPDQQIRDETAQALTSVRSPEAYGAVPRLLSMLARPEAPARRGYREHLAMLINAMAPRPEPVRKVLIDDIDLPMPAALLKLRAIGPDSTPAQTASVLEEVMIEPDERVRVLAMWVGELMLPVDAARVEKLTGILRADSSGSVGAMIMPQLAKARPRSAAAVEAMIAGLKHPSDMVRSEAAGAFRSGGGGGGGSGGGGEDAGVADWADAALRRRAEQALLDVLRSDKQWFVRRAAVAALIEEKAFGGVLGEAIGIAVADEHDDVVNFALQFGALKLKDQTVLREPMLRRIQGKGTASARMGLIRTLDRISPGWPGAYETLKKIAMDDGEVIQVRYAAVESLGAFGEKAGELTPLFKGLAGGEDSTMRRVASKALADVEVKKK